MAKKPAIPEVLGELRGQARISFDKAVKEHLEVTAGRRGGKIAPLDTSALTGVDLTLAQKINELIALLQ